jgi:hypothetical protein
MAQKLNKSNPATCGTQEKNYEHANIKTARDKFR